MNMEPSYSNLLLVSDNSESIMTYIVLGFGLVFLIPFSFIAIKRKSKEIEYFHPGQEKLGCVLLIEFLVFATCLAAFIYS